MTTGEYLLSKSPLASASALQHLLSMQTGGVEKMLFCSQRFVVSTYSEICVTRKANRQQPTESAATPKPSSITGKKVIEVFVAHRPSIRITAIFQTDQIYVTRRATRSITAERQDSAKLFVSKQQVST